MVDSVVLSIFGFTAKSSHDIVDFVLITYQNSKTIKIKLNQFINDVKAVKGRMFYQPGVNK